MIEYNYRLAKGWANKAELINLSPEELKEIDIRLVDIEGRICVFISGISLEKVERYPGVEKVVKDMVARLIKASKEMGWDL